MTNGTGDAQLRITFDDADIDSLVNGVRVRLGDVVSGAANRIRKDAPKDAPQKAVQKEKLEEIRSTREVSNIFQRMGARIQQYSTKMNYGSSITNMFGRTVGSVGNIMQKMPASFSKMNAGMQGVTASVGRTAGGMGGMLLNFGKLGIAGAVAAAALLLISKAVSNALQYSGSAVAAMARLDIAFIKLGIAIGPAVGAVVDIFTEIIGILTPFLEIISTIIHIIGTLVTSLLKLLFAVKIIPDVIHKAKGWVDGIMDGFGRWVDKVVRGQVAVQANAGGNAPQNMAVFGGAAGGAGNINIFKLPQGGQNGVPVVAAPPPQQGVENEPGTDAMKAAMTPVNQEAKKTQEQTQEVVQETKRQSTILGQILEVMQGMDKSTARRFVQSQMDDTLRDYETSAEARSQMDEAYAAQEAYRRVWGRP